MPSSPAGRACRNRAHGAGEPPGRRPVRPSGTTGGRGAVGSGPAGGRPGPLPARCRRSAPGLRAPRRRGLIGTGMDVGVARLGLVRIGPPRPAVGGPPTGVALDGATLVGTRLRVGLAGGSSLSLVRTARPVDLLLAVPPVRLRTAGRLRGHWRAGRPLVRGGHGMRKGRRSGRGLGDGRPDRSLGFRPRRRAHGGARHQRVRRGGRSRVRCGRRGRRRPGPRGCGGRGRCAAGLLLAW